MSGRRNCVGDVGEVEVAVRARRLMGSRENNTQVDSEEEQGRNR